MKLERTVAQSWVNAFSIMLLMNAAGAAVSGIIYLILGIAAPADAFLEGVTKIVSIAIGIFALIAAPLLYFWGKGLWERKPWARIVTLVFAGVTAAVALLALALGLMLLFVNTEFGRSQLLGTLVLIVAVVLGAYAGFVIWLFMHRDVVAVFTKPQAFVWTDETKAGIVRGWALLMWVSAATVFLAAILFALASPLLAAAFINILSDFGYGVSTGLAIGVLLLIALLLAMVGAIMHLVSKGLWNFKNWARIVLIIFAIISFAFAFVNFIGALVQYQGISYVADTLSNLIYGGGIALLEIWFLQYAAKELFVAPPAKPKVGKRR